MLVTWCLQILMLMAWAEMMACKDMSDPYG